MMNGRLERLRRGVARYRKQYWDERHDVLLFAGIASEVICDATGGMLSKPNSAPSAVREFMEEREERDIRDAVNDVLERIEDEVNALADPPTGLLNALEEIRSDYPAPSRPSRGQ